MPKTSRPDSPNLNLEPLFESSGYSVAAINQEGEIIFANKNFLNLTNKTFLEGQNFDKLFSFKEKEKILKIADICTSSGTFEREEIELTFENKLHLVQLSVTRSDDGPTKYLVSLINLTTLKQKESLKLDFVSIIAHELRAYLTSIRGYLSLLREEADKDAFSEQAKTFLERAASSADSLQTLVENLLTISIFERSSIQLKMQSVNWPKLVEKVTDEFAIRAKEKNLKLTFNPPKVEIPKISVDPFRITEVISNLLTNAIDFTKPGGMVEILISKDDKFIITQVKDSGIGIPAEAIGNLFTRYFKIGGRLSEGSKGTGLGLHISKTIVEMHDGKIWVESQPGKGSIFSFSLPISRK